MSIFDTMRGVFSDPLVMAGASIASGADPAKAMYTAQQAELQQQAIDAKQRKWAAEQQMKLQQQQALQSFFAPSAVAPVMQGLAAPTPPPVAPEGVRQPPTTPTAAITRRDLGKAVIEERDDTLRPIDAQMIAMESAGADPMTEGAAPGPGYFENVPPLATTPQAGAPSLAPITPPVYGMLPSTAQAAGAPAGAPPGAPVAAMPPTPGLSPWEAFQGRVRENPAGAAYALGALGNMGPAVFSAAMKEDQDQFTRYSDAAHKNFSPEVAKELEREFVRNKAKASTGATVNFNDKAKEAKYRQQQFHPEHGFGAPDNIPTDQLASHGYIHVEPKTEKQVQASVLLPSAMHGKEVINGLVSEGFDTSNIRDLSKILIKLAEQDKDSQFTWGMLRDFKLNENEMRYLNAVLDIANAHVYLTSGAAVTAREFATRINLSLPTVNEGDESLRDKRKRVWMWVDAVGNPMTRGQRAAAEYTYKKSSQNFADWDKVANDYNNAKAEGGAGQGGGTDGTVIQIMGNRYGPK